MSHNLRFFIACVLFYSVSFAQTLKKETLTNQGSSHFVYANNKSYFIQESIGQASVIRTFHTGNYSVRQGFLQPINVSLLDSDSNTLIDAIIFPNPFSETVTINFREPIFDVLDLYISDMSGRVIISNRYNPSQSLSIFINDVRNGVYMMTIVMREKKLVAKLIKR
ncbi:T9SS type A sorting domain-containing protein [Psychroserpens algicola]|uniref:T9SS type A sorting domain-containing protein n=1 Tax=Psychroserpens algicola TaxID=1719034 RepID=A0ABT0H705_9FLAO|nr:T9SS type A sorting domain-containing protein [Psychroserpens algicola]MCK8479617.1 T9SS type A sorting domain-containing protein [Psychroserpens algicola]